MWQGYHWERERESSPKKSKSKVRISLSRPWDKIISEGWIQSRLKHQSKFTSKYQEVESKKTRHKKLEQENECLEKKLSEKNEHNSRIRNLNQRLLDQIKDYNKIENL